VWLLAVEAGADLREGAANLAAQEGQDHDDHYGDEDENECILDQALALLLQLLDLSAHFFFLLFRISDNFRIIAPDAIGASDFISILPVKARLSYSHVVLLYLLKWGNKVLSFPLVLCV